MGLNIRKIITVVSILLLPLLYLCQDEHEGFSGHGKGVFAAIVVFPGGLAMKKYYCCISKKLGNGKKLLLDLREACQ